jgi:hypothetical protein
MKANAGESYCGMSANSKVELHFTDEPSEEIKASVLAKWESLTEIEETAKVDHYNKLVAAEADAKAGIPLADILTLTTAEKKIFMGLPLTDEDRENILIKYPQS